MVTAKSRNYIIDMKTGFYNRRFFNIRMREERRRTERSGSPLSVLTLNISDLADLIEKRPKLKIHQMKKVITNVIRENTRDIDIKNWHDDTTVKILMPETPKSGATILAEKLQEKVNDALRVQVPRYDGGIRRLLGHLRRVKAATRNGGALVLVDICSFSIPP